MVSSCELCIVGKKFADEFERETILEVAGSCIRYGREVSAFGGWRLVRLLSTLVKVVTMTTGIGFPMNS